jgi:hypothetical protein
MTLGITNITFRTITCNKCNKAITYEQSKEKETIEAPENAWVNGLRTIQTLDGRLFTYCTDKCEIEATSDGVHNKPEAKQIIDASANPAGQLQQAAAEAAAAQEATKALKAGPVKGKLVKA